MGTEMMNELVKKAHEIDSYIEKKLGISMSEGIALMALVRGMGGGSVYVELGAFRGRSGAFLSAFAKEGDKVYSIDHWESRHDRATYVHNLQKLGYFDRVEPIHSTSEEACKNWNKEIDLLLIDGNHHYDSVSIDYFRWYPHVKVGGIIAFHDYGSARWPGVERFVDNYAMKELRLGILVGSLWIGVK